MGGRQLTVLTAGLDLTAAEPTVAATVFRHEQGRLDQVRQHRDPLADYGIVGDGPPDAPLRVPAAVREAVDRSLAGDSVLAVRLVTPYGFLGAVPWETLFEAAPVFRVPDHLPVVADHCAELSAVVAVSAPAGSDWAFGYLREHLRDLRQLDTGDIHVFADRATTDALHRLDPERLGIRVHDPRRARDAFAGQTGIGESRFDPPGYGRAGRPPPTGRLWSDWISAELNGRPVRTLELILDAGWDDDRPILAVSPDPDRPVGTSRCSYVSGDDIRRLADVLGAATVALGSPPGNPADAATRMCADALGRQRSGPTLYTSLPDDPAGEQLAGMYRFLSTEPSRRELSRHRSLFAYLQPEHVHAQLSDGWPERFGATVLPAAYRPETPGPAAVSEAPAWVNTSERYVATELASLSRPPEVPTVQPAAYRQAYEDGKVDALNEIQDIIGRHREAQ